MRTVGGLLKTDSRGHVQTPPGRREMLLDEFEQTGASAAAFAKLVGVRYSTFAAWVQRRRMKRAVDIEPVRRSAEPATLKWVEASVEAACAPKSTALSVHLPGGARMEIGDGAQVLLAAELLRVLAAGGAGC
ncbi:MAG: IS66 family insertion sequence element accessory protein TnpB [Rhodobacteraceae bacterium]|nr:IS66 family insertion sequence element accessory protein TnpB [Paracoccaceae bacterium]